jgi:TrmH family RNA methyltransferase
VLKHVYALPEWAEQHQAIQALTPVTQAELEKITGLQTPNQVLAVAAKQTLQEEPFLKDCLSLVLDGIQDPGNMGSIIRIADWFGIYQVIAATDTADIYNPKVVQATMGSITRVKVWYKPLDEWLAKVDATVFGALLNGDSVYTCGKISSGVLVIGNEGQGIRPAVMPFIQKRLTIPRIGGAESLNAAVAAGIILSHVT